MAKQAFAMTKPMVDKPALKTLLQECRGSVSALSKRLGMSRQAVAARLAAAGLSQEAAKLRIQHGIRGRRTALEHGSVNHERERTRISKALERHKNNQSAAARALGIGRTRLQRSMIRLGIPF